ncbi:MAG: YceI family protein [Thermoanaerobaculia bacterium]|nr:YceI family protein [Thermoanaerobaculia bacterium]
MRTRNLIFGTVVTTFLLAGSVQAEVWKVDDSHTEIKFSVNHFFTPVTGRFESFDVELDFNAEDPSLSKVEAKIKVASVNTGNDRRDKHLRSADWFDASKYPYMTFESTAVRQVGDQIIAKGNLTIRGVAHEVVLPITILGKKEIPESMRRMLGGSREIASFQAKTAVDRSDYGVGVGDWAADTVVGEKVEIELLLEAHLK